MSEQESIISNENLHSSEEVLLWEDLGAVQKTLIRTKLKEDDIKFLGFEKKFHVFAKRERDFGHLVWEFNEAAIGYRKNTGGFSREGKTGGVLSSGTIDPREEEKLELHTKEVQFFFADGTELTATVTPQEWKRINRMMNSGEKSLDVQSGDEEWTIMVDKIVRFSYPKSPSTATAF